MMNSLLPIFQPFGAVARRLAMLLVWVCMVLMASPVQAQGSPFTCDVVFYQMRNVGANSLLVKFQAVSTTVTPTAVYSAAIGTNINAIGYNPVDNYIYGIGTTGTPQLYRIGQTGYQLVGTIQTTAIAGTSIAAFTPTGAVFDAAGRYYFVGQGGGAITPPRVFRVDSIPVTGPIEVSHIYNLTPTFATNFGDFDFNGAGGPSGLLMGATAGVHHRLQLTPSGTSPLQGTAALTTATLATPVGGVGSAFYDAFTGRFFVFDNGNDNFWQITNPDVGVPGSVLTDAVIYPGPPAFPGPYGSTDGSSCPISGTRIANLGITKSDARTTVTAAGVTAYTITVTNAGPYPANYSAVRDPPAPGLQKLSVTCSAPGGPPSAVCPTTLSTTTFEAGVQIITFPPGTTLVFTLNALVTGAVGSLVTNTATVTPAIDTTDPNLANNISVDVDAVAGTSTTVISGGQQCPAGSVQSSINLLSNGDFSAAAPFSSDATTIGVINTYAAANFVARQTGTQSYLPVLPPPSGIVQNPFPGDSARSVSGGDSWLLHNGKTGAANYRIWYQPVTGLTVGRVYQVMVYASNATRPGTTSATVPDLRIQVSSGAATVTVAALVPANETLVTGDLWTLVQGTFTATATAMTISVADFAAASAEPGGGDVAGLAQATLRECLPAANVRVTKTDGTATVVSTGTTAYTITVSNPSTVTATNTLIVDPPVANFIKGTITCVVVAGSAAGTACPTALSILGMEGAGLTVPLIGLNSTVSFVVRGTVTGPPGNTITNIVTVSGVSYTDPDTSDNQATDIDSIIGSANVSITKTNLVTTLVSGTTTSYTVTVSNIGPSTVNNAVFRDPSIAGLSCTSVTCTAVIGAAACPSAAATTVPLMQGIVGIVIPSMVPPSSVSFSVACNVTATGAN